ncbi:MAG: hypothetical protein J6S43_05910 [Lentisphaeria bacterium]|nr:hypothetical protein [Lentisphaeria bacterium]
MHNLRRTIITGTERNFLKMQPIRIQPILAREGKPSVDIAEASRIIGEAAVFNDLICIRDKKHWEQVISTLPDDVDAIMPISSPCYPTEIWNESPEVLARRGLPVIFWPLIRFDEPDFWKWSATDMLRALGVTVYLVNNCHEGVTLIKAMAVKKFLASSRMVVFGKQNFPWNVHAAGKFIRESFGTELIVKPLEAFRKAGENFTEKELLAFWEQHSARYLDQVPDRRELLTALRTYFGIRAILDAEKACGFGVNCYGELIIEGSRDVPCLAQCLAREEGFIAACDGDFCAMLNMAMVTFLLDAPCMMSNLYPLNYIGALTEHFGDPLAAKPEYAVYGRNLARLAHCGYVGVVSPEMVPGGRARLSDWGGTYELKRDGKGCGVDSDLAGKQEFTGMELHFNGKDMVLVHGEILESTRHAGMPHCESSALLRFDDLDFFVRHVSREHIVVTYGDRRRELEILAQVLGVNIHN